MFVCAQGTPLPLSWMMLGTNGTALSLGSDDPYQAWHDYEKKGSFDSGNFMRYVQNCVIAVRLNISPAHRSASAHTSATRKFNMRGTYLLCFTFKLHIYLLPMLTVLSIVLWYFVTFVLIDALS